MYCVVYIIHTCVLSSHLLSLQFMQDAEEVIQLLVKMQIELGEELEDEIQVSS